MELPCSFFFFSLHYLILFTGIDNEHARIHFLHLVLLFLLPLYVCYFYFTKPAKLIYFLTSQVRFHCFHFLALILTNCSLVSCIIILWNHQRNISPVTCNCKVQTFLHPLLHFSFQRLLYCLYRPFHPKKYQTCSSQCWLRISIELEYARIWGIEKKQLHVWHWNVYKLK